MNKSIKGLDVIKGDGLTKKSKDENLYEILNSLPEPDVKMKLSSTQKYWWYFFGKEFLTTKQLTKLDLIHLQSAAFWMDARCQAYFKIKAAGYEGLVQTFKSGATNVTGHVTIIEKADKRLDEISAHFGLSIKDRSKLNVEKPDDNQLSLFEQFMQQKTS